ncbi:MAG: sigma-70 family RNA polymerase sigma factor [Gemmatimonadetes bacterium]|nr:sigma-70 family RNA polymerase sigma factor [Gemmatimonadota bacterium]
MDERVVSEWALRFRGGDEESFTKLVEALTRPLIAMAYRYTGDWEWARDLTQETWVRVHRHICRYDPSRPFPAWLHALHRNGCLDHVRSQVVRRERTSDRPVPRTDAFRAPDDPLAEVEWSEFRARVVEATRALTESQRQVFVRVDLEERPRAEVARELGITAGTLRTTLHYARRRIADALRESGGAP